MCKTKTRSANIYKVSTQSRSTGETITRYEVRLRRKLPNGKTVDYQRRFDTLRQAEQHRNQVVADIQNGTYEERPAQPPGSIEPLTVADALNRYADYLDSTKPEPLSSRERNRITFIGKQPIGKTLLAALSALEVDTYIELRLNQGVSESTVKKEVAVIRRMRKIAHRAALNLGVPRTVLYPERDLKGSCRRTRRPSDDEFKMLLEHFESNDQDMYYLVRLATSTTMRLGELCSLQWEHYQQQTYTIRLLAQNTKTKTARDVPLRSQAIEILAEMQPKDVGRVFNINSNSATQRFRRACKKLGITDLRFHDLRREGCSQLAMLGLSDRQLMQFTGHKTPSMLSIYTNLAAQQIGMQVRDLEKRLSQQSDRGSSTFATDFTERPF